MARRRQWFYFRDGTAHGPFSAGEMRDLARSGTLLESDLLWRPGMDRQRPAGQSTSLWADDGPDVAADRDGPEPRSMRMWIGAALVGVALVLTVFVVIVLVSLQHSRATAVVPPREVPPTPAVDASGSEAAPAVPDEVAGRRPVVGAVEPRDTAGAAASAVEDAAVPTAPAEPPAPARKAGDDF